MGAVSAKELSKIVYLDQKALDGRALLIMPFWDNTTWRLWIEAPPGIINEVNILDASHSNYVANQPARNEDISIDFINFMWQRASYPEIGNLINGIQDDFHILATSALKIRHFFELRESIEKSIISSFVKTEMEYMITVARSVFDLLQEILSKIWNNRIILIDQDSNAVKNRHKMPDKFTKMAIHGRNVPKPIDELISHYAIPLVLAEQYNCISPFYVALLRSRDKFIHGGGSVETIFVTEKGFCVDREAQTFSHFEWKENHRYNDRLVSLLPWVAHIIFGTMQACEQIVGAFASVISMPPEMAPGYRVFIRDPANRELHKLSAVVDGRAVWWSDPVPG
ncbi:hypothetical protein [Xanthobacter flavus]|uniref:hypothetical protein n=1 Tax=Xanthobacter flavus TaxID=281 RepID=UPI0037272151